jgi:hypothetical protein
MRSLSLEPSTILNGTFGTEPSTILNGTFKLITSDGDGKLEQELSLQPGLKMSHNTINNNTKTIHEVILQWARTKIVLGNAKEWDEACCFQAPFQDVNLWIDSSDFEMKESPATKGWYSKKLEGRGVRIQFVVDGTERVRFLEGPLDPGQYDEFYLRLRKAEFEKNFQGGKIVGDNHYAPAMKYFKDHYATKWSLRRTN